MKTLQYEIRSKASLAGGAAFALAVLPVITALFCVYSFAARVAIGVGHLPEYGKPDPKDTPYQLHYDLAYYSLGSALLLSPTFLICYTTIAICSRRLQTIVLPILSYLVFLSLFILDPYGIFNWLAD